MAPKKIKTPVSSPKRSSPSTNKKPPPTTPKPKLTKPKTPSTKKPTSATTSPKPNKALKSPRPASPRSSEAKHKEWFNNILKLRDFVIFGSDYCIWCANAKELAKTKNVSFVYYDIESLPTGYFGYVKKRMSKTHSTIPIIFYKGKFVGGFDAMNKIVK